MSTMGIAEHGDRPIDFFSDARVRWILALIFAVCILRLWVMPLGSSFWVDEMGTVFVVHHGAQDATLRVAPQVADSIYYVLPAIAEKLAGFSEVSYRFFSVLAMGGALFAITRLAIRLIDPQAGWFMAFACLSSRNFNFQAADARPYALGTLILSVALLELVRWLDKGKWLDGLAFALCAGLLWWVHLVFWPLYLIFVVYGLYRILSKDHQASKVQILVVSIGILLACIPVALRALTLLKGAEAHVVVPPPKFQELLNELKLLQVTGVCTLAALANRYWRWNTDTALKFGSLVLIAAWWLIDPVVLFAFSKLTGNSLFLPRYLFLAMPGVAMTTCLLASLFLPARVWRPAALALGCGVLLFSGHWTHLWPEHQRSGWRNGAEILRQWTAGEDVPVIAPSTFIEARSPVWVPGYPVNSFVYSHLLVYPMGGRVYTFPFEPSDEATAYARELVAGILQEKGRFAIYGGDHNVDYWREWFIAQPALRDWKSEVRGLYGDVKLVTFRDPNRH